MSSYASCSAVHAVASSLTSTTGPMRCNESWGACAHENFAAGLGESKMPSNGVGVNFVLMVTQIRLVFLLGGYSWALNMHCVFCFVGLVLHRCCPRPGPVARQEPRFFVEPNRKRHWRVGSLRRLLGALGAPPLPRYLHVCFCVLC